MLLSHEILKISIFEMSYLFKITTVSSRDEWVNWDRGNCMIAHMPINQSWMNHRSVRKTKCNVTLCHKSPQTTTSQMKLNETQMVILITKGKLSPFSVLTRIDTFQLLQNTITVQNEHSPTRKQEFDFPNCDMQGSSKITPHHLAMAMWSNWGQPPD